MTDAKIGMAVRTHTLQMGEHVEVYAEEREITEQGPVWELDEPRVFVGPDLFSIDVGSAVRDLLGHANVRTTQIYTAVPDGARRAAVAAAASFGA